MGRLGSAGRDDDNDDDDDDDTPRTPPLMPGLPTAGRFDEDDDEEDEEDLGLLLDDDDLEAGADRFLPFWRSSSESEPASRSCDTNRRIDIDQRYGKRLIS